MGKYSLKEDPRPADLWYWRDWRGDLQVQRCSLAAQGLWINMLGIMAESEMKGTLVISGAKVSSEDLARILGHEHTEIVGLLVELERNRVFSRMEDGAIYNRRMFKQRMISESRAESGRLGAEARWKNYGKTKKDIANVSGETLAKEHGEIIANTDEAFPPDNDTVFIPKNHGKALSKDKGNAMANVSGEGHGKRWYGSIKRESSLNLKSFLEIDIRLTQLLIDLMQKNNPESTIIKKLTPDRQKRWIDECRLLRESDGKTERDIELIIRFSQSDQFWKVNILSMSKLREKWDQLWLKAQKPDPMDGAREWLKDKESEDVV
jgi:hypothetical protein